MVRDHRLRTMGELYRGVLILVRLDGKESSFVELKLNLIYIVLILIQLDGEGSFRIVEVELNLI